MNARKLADDARRASFVGDYRTARQLYAKVATEAKDTDAGREAQKARDQLAVGKEVIFALVATALVYSAAWIVVL